MSILPAKTPLNESLATQINKQINFVALCTDAADFTTVKIKKVSATLFEVICANSSKYRSYELRKDSNDDFYILGAATVGQIVEGNPSSPLILLTRDSNKEFAVSVTANEETRWIPDHGVGVAFAVNPMTITVDGESIDYASMEINAEVQGSKVVVSQHCYGRFSDVNIAEFWVECVIGLKGVVNYGWTFKALQSLLVNTAYSLMLPANQDVLLTAVTALKNSVVSTGDESTVNFKEEKLLIKSAGWLSSVNKNYIAGGTTGNSENTMFVWQRAAEPKIYFRPVTNTNLATGDILTGNGIIGVAEITNIYDTIMGY